MNQADVIRGRVEAAGRELAETLPGRFAAALLEMRIVDRALALSSKLFVAILPLSILSTALVSKKAFGDELVQRFRLNGEGARAAEVLFASPAQVESGVGALGALILVSSVVSFARALERVYLDAWELPAQRAAVRGRLAWLAGFCVYLAAIFPARTALVGAGVPGLTPVVSAVGGGLLFLWTPYVLLGRRVGWRRLLPTAVISAGSIVVFGVGSAIALPRIITHNTERYGYIGFAFSLVTWLFCGAVVIIAAAVLGAQLDRSMRGVPEPASAPQVRSATRAGGGAGAARP